MCLHPAPGTAEPGCTDALASGTHGITGKRVSPTGRKGPLAPQDATQRPPSHPPAPSCQPIVHRGSKELLLCLQFTPLFPLLTPPAINLAQQ